MVCRESSVEDAGHLGLAARSEVGLVSLCQPERAAAVVTLVPKSLPELQTTKQRL